MKNLLRLCSLVVLATGDLARAQSGAAAPEAWLARITEDLHREEYHFSAQEAGLFSAPNRSQNLRSQVSAAGLEVFPRDTDGSAVGASWNLRLATVGVGRADDAWPLECHAVSADGTRAELDHGCLVEWFENSERGIEQGWTIARPPAGSGALEITMEVAGDLSLRIHDGGRSGTFVDACGEARLAYEGLRAWDATGRELGARLVPAPEGLVVWVDDAHAAYPITVDPLLGNPSWATHSDQDYAEFGCSVSTAGDVNGDGYSDVIVGALGYDNGETSEGRAYVYHGSASGLSTVAAWTAESNQTAASFGSSVSMAGDVNGDGYSDVIVGARRFDGGEMNEGRAYVYHGSAAGLSTSASWTAESDHAGAGFGESVSTAGDLNGDGYSDVIVGADDYDNGETNEGRVYVYHGSAAGLSTGVMWSVESDQAFAHFGESASTAGDVNGDGYSDVVIGAPGVPGTSEGLAFVYLGSASGLAVDPAWTAGPNVGISVSTAGDVNGDGYSDVIVGKSESAFVYHGSPGGLSASANWTGESNEEGSAFGSSVSTAGDVNGDGYSDVIVGASSYTPYEEGGAFAYHGSATGLSSIPAWIAVQLGYDEAFFGSSVSTAGDVNGDGYCDVIVGAPNHSFVPKFDPPVGRAYVYYGSAAALGTGASWTTESDQADARMFTAACAGDVNGDGYSDVIVSSDLYDNGEANEGRVLLYHGSPSGPATNPAWTAEGNQAGAEFGRSASSAGDVNGDGYSDVVVGARFYDNGETDEGRAFLYLGSAVGLDVDAAWTAEANQASAEFGYSTSTAGDVNGDGYADVVVGAWLYDAGETDEGRSFLYLGSASGLGTTATWTAESDQAGARFGTVVATAGDVNADGYSDVLVSAREFDAGEIDEGRIFAYHGSEMGLGTAPAWTVESNTAGANLGESLATAGDMNGDGYADVIVGAPFYENGQTAEGRAFVHRGSSGGLSATPAWSRESHQIGARFGDSVSAAGDVNGDGYADVIVGAPFYENGQADEGRAFLYLGFASGSGGGAEWTAEGNQAAALFGRSVAAAGDVNGDGYSDVIVAARDYDGGEIDEGSVFTYLGNNGDAGRVLAPVQLKLGPSDQLIGLLGNSDRINSFRIRATLTRGLAGFDWAQPVVPLVKLEWQVGVPGGFDSGIASGDFVPITTGPMEFDEIVNGLNEGVTYRWRARFRTNNPLLPVTPWFSAPGNSRTEAKLRTLPLEFKKREPQ